MRRAFGIVALLAGLMPVVASATVINLNNAGAIAPGTFVGVSGIATWAGEKNGAFNGLFDYAEFQVSKPSPFDLRVNTVPNLLALPIGLQWALGTSPGAQDVVAENSRTNIVDVLTGLHTGQNYFVSVWSLDGGSLTIAAAQATTPLPGALVLLGSGLAGLGALVRRRRSQGL